MPLRWFIVLFGLTVAQPALAQQQAPPTRVGAITYVSGNIAFHAAGETQWSAAGVNYPVATGGSFWTDPQARAELQIGPATIDMAGGTEIDVTRLDEEVAQIAAPQGRLYLHLRALEAGQSFEIDLPQGAVWLLQSGTYDIDTGATDQPARIAVFDGSVRFVGGGADIGVNAGDVAVLSGSNPVTAQFQPAAPDAFVEWCRARDYRQNQVAATTHYVSPQMTGYADLAQYGSWQQSPQYGEVWYPSQVPPDWVPYRDGRWVWVEPWGWTWVGQQPWGFAPFHYGRWAYIDDRWGWVPGQYQPQPVYAPALVAFVGAAAGGLAIAGAAGPAVGWFPLAPGEPYWPSYTHNRNYIRNVNVANVRNINTIITRSNGSPSPQPQNANFANRRFTTVVPRRVFANADPVASHAMHVAPAVLAKAPVAPHPPALKPAAKPTAMATRGPATTRPVPRGPGMPPPAHAGAAVPTSSAGHPHPPGIPPAHPAPPAHTAAIPPHPAAANATEHGPHLPAAGATATREPGHVPGPPEHAATRPATAPSRAELPGTHPPTPEVPPGARPAAHPPATASIHREAPPRPGSLPERRPAIVNEPRPAIPPHAAGPSHPAPAAHAQIIRPPAVAHPAPAPHPPGPVVVHRAAAPHPPAPAVVRPPPAPHPPPPAAVHPVPVAHRAPPPRPAAPHPPAAHAAPAPHGGGHPGEKHE